jgi:molybdenum cofactor cytidylyltransferase
MGESASQDEAAAGGMGGLGLLPAVILAAGASRRLGQPKQLVRVAGDTLLGRTVRAALAACAPVLVVLGSGAEAMAGELAGLPVTLVRNDQWREGMAASIRAGVQALPAGAEGVLLLVCDQPAVDAALLTRLLDARRRRPDAIIACGYAGTRGVPALFPAGCLEQLLALRGDRGARELLRGADVEVLPFPEGALDVDRPGDLPGLREA